MNIEEIVNGLKAKGMKDDEIKEVLEKAKKDIDAYLGNQNPEVPPAPAKSPAETDEAKLNRVFGNI